MNSKEMVSVPREQLLSIVEHAEDEFEHIGTDLQGVVTSLREILAKPAEQHQGKPVPVTPEMLRAAQLKSELGGYVTANWAGAYDVLTELYQVMHAASAPHADPGEVERLRLERRRMDQALVACANERETLRAQLAERDALLRDKSGDLIRMAAHLISAPLFALQDLQDEDKKMTRARVDHAVDVADARLKDAAYELRRVADALSASAEPSAPAPVHLLEIDLNKIHADVTYQYDGGVPVTVRSQPMDAPPTGAKNWDLTITGYLYGCRIVSEDVEPKSDISRRIDFSWGGGITVEGPLPSGTTFKIHGPNAPVERDERAAFERWYIADVGVKSANLARGTSGAYVDEDANAAWEGWEARACLEGSKPTVLSKCVLCDQLQADLTARDQRIDQLEQQPRVPAGFALVPQSMLLSKEVIGVINFHCGDTDQEEGGQFGQYTDGRLWVGYVLDDDGNKVHGLHLATDEYPEEGSTTLIEFPAPEGMGDWQS